jgi:hypothetical protein
VGELLHIELDDQRLRAVAAIDGDWLASVEEDIFFSRRQ